MFTVTLDWELSGKSNTRRPLSSWYSVMPSTDAIFLAIPAAKQSWPATSATTLNINCFLVISEIDERKCMVQALNAGERQPCTGVGALKTNGNSAKFSTTSLSEM